MLALKAVHADFADLAFRIGAAPLVIPQVRQRMKLAAPRTALRRPDAPVRSLLDVLIHSPAWALHYHLHEAGE